MTVTEEHIVEVAQEVWFSLLGLDVTRMERGSEELDALAQLDGMDGMDARVHIDGAWRGQVRLQCGTQVAVRLAAAMLYVQATDVDPAAAADAIGELANVVGGNIKSLLPPPSRLSVPVVSNRRAPRGRAATASLRRVTAVSFLCPAGPFEVGLWHLPPGGSARSRRGPCARIGAGHQCH